MEDKTFAQAIQQMHDRLTQEIEQAATIRLPRLHQGQTVQQATADISDPMLRRAVSELLLYSRVHGFLPGLQRLGILNQAQVDELNEYLQQHLILVLKETT